MVVVGAGTGRRGTCPYPDIDLADGRRIAADYVNLGTAILRGATPDGRLDIPWQDIEVLRFAR